MNDLLVLLPPSRGTEPGGDGPPWPRTATGEGPQAAVRTRLCDVVATLVADPAADVRRLLHDVPEAQEPAAREQHRRLDSAPTMPAGWRYAGVMYGALDLRSLDLAAADGMLRIVSPLWGLLAPTDPIPDYRVGLAGIAGVGTPATAWRPVLDELLAELASGRTVWDLRTSGYDRLGRLPDDTRRVTVRFVRDGRRAPAAIAKQARGRLARALLTDPTTRRPERWDADGAASGTVRIDVAALGLGR